MLNKQGHHRSGKRHTNSQTEAKNLKHDKPLEDKDNVPDVTTEEDDCSKKHHNETDQEISHCQGHQEIVGHVLKLPAVSNTKFSGNTIYSDKNNIFPVITSLGPVK